MNYGLVLSCVFSKPITGATYQKIKVNLVSTKIINSPLSLIYSVEYFTSTQVFHKKINKTELDQIISTRNNNEYKNIVIQTEEETITLLTNKKGKTTELHHRTHPNNINPLLNKGGNRVKQYILPEGVPVPFLIELGVMTPEGKVHADKFDKFKQINRFLEYVDDILPQLRESNSETNNQKQDYKTTPSSPIRITDFGCGKSYLTFAIYHFLVNIKGIPAEITGLDLKKDVIEFCSTLATKCNYTGLKFSCGDIAEYRKTTANTNSISLPDPDLVITLHACDTATDYALAFAIEHNTKVILSVPCCQHELNTKLSNIASSKPDPIFNGLLKYGIVKDRFCALSTDVMRAELLTACGYRTQIMEFIDIEHTPKNLLIRAVKNSSTKYSNKSDLQNTSAFLALKKALGQELTLEKLLTQQ